jgi:hypothetical protein
LKYWPNKIIFEGNFDANFWTYSALIVAKKFLLAEGPSGGIRSDGEVRISHKILALDYIRAVSDIQNDLQKEKIFDGWQLRNK